MTRLRYALVIIIVLITAMILQYTKVINILPRIFWIENERIGVQQDRPVSSVTIPEFTDSWYIIHTSDKEMKNNVCTHLLEICRNAHIAYETINIEEEGHEGRIAAIPDGATIIIANEITRDLHDDDIQLLEQKVAAGSYLNILIRSYDPRLYELAGFSGLDGFIDTEGLIFDSELFPGLDELEQLPNKVFYSSSMELVRDQDTTPLLSSVDGTPLVWTHRLGEGSVMFCNTTILQDKLNRGLLLQLLLKHSRYQVATIFPKKIFNIDDFPAPLPAGNDPVIFEEYQRDTIKFFKEIWWSDVRDLASRYDLALTGLAIGSYNDDTIPPFEPISETDLETINYFARKLAETRGEIGIHGYNHNSLLLEGQTDFEEFGYNPWPSVESMSEALRYLESELTSRLGKIEYRTYVAPSNLATKESKQAVLDVFEGIRVFAGIYTGSRKIAGSFIQEFGPDPDIPGTYDFPRFSSGYHPDPRTMWSIYNAIAELGVFNHFIHPDDLLDEERSGGLGWSELLKGLEEILSETFERFPFLVPATDHAAYLDYLAYEKMRLYTTLIDDTLHLYLEDAVLPVYAYLRVDEPVIDTEGLRLYGLGREGLYLVELRSPEAQIKLLSR